jgi:hypothetical protein
MEGPLLSPAGMPRLPSANLLSAAGSVQRVPSGNVYDNFPCVRVGDVILPSSMDLRELRGRVPRTGFATHFAGPTRCCCLSLVERHVSWGD